MKYLNKETKQAQSYIQAYKMATKTHLYQCYVNYSIHKENAFNWCIDEMRKVNGFDGRILSYNCMQFTYAFRVNNDLRIETKSYTYYIKDAFSN